MKKFALLCAISLAIAGGAGADVGTVVAQAPVITGGHGTVTKDRVNVRSRGNKAAEIVAQLHKGDSVEIVEHKGEWLRITLPANAKCYVSAKLVPDGAAAADTVNVRCGPGTNYKDVGKLAKGEKVDIVNHRGDWVEIKPTPQCTGWVAAEMVEMAAPAAAPPAPIPSTEVVTPPVSLPPAVSAPLAPLKPAATEADVHLQYVVKDGYLAAVKENPAPGSYALMTPDVGGRQYIIAYLEAPQMNLERYYGKHVRVLGNQRWKRDERYPVIAVERVDMVW
jgi:SH3-like domain-containing protein